MLIEWSPAARVELRQIIDYLSHRNPAAALQLKRSIEASVLALSHRPHLYRPGRIGGTREMVVHPNYLVVYKVTDNIRILSVLHARQRYP
ncbi:MULTISPECIES: type II toxin-antitoxin system RelE/ParE family toxin [unclassified Pseudomonas]|uniref:type II toxin-antitoxin system RelE/ParE family toxin n=1 Tax=unclassified Pseudomonas TaxID=196821 RepID=UPI000C87E82B|nr:MULTISPECIES: type II toxin-antitoxin system RelE/ParE family toxin [unclassified Pseudomonas]MBJ2317755.1 type II toxin-antitoxin system RelE/ParE family toxin [Pseudomonas fluorescens]PMZ74967.1 type II toxin-antitoxin system mRNA interferase toxin, RelE/StbE family [Pseudomonas sp. GW247-3R2A]PMY74843.1 type II toxin-antitoxin system mRNA interferase toxin, RelE/StbE family [Pseudomonas sp. MPR-R3A]PMY96554.1 type II toxin-antitoxin system mRNA interferase toxin, RelE/StbE family [Pseudom